MPNVFAAAGVAAALAASLTAFAAPIDGAVAAPPLTVNVVVDNPAKDPALTRSVDNPGRIAYQSSFRRIDLFDQPVLQYIDGGSIPVLGASTDASISTSSQVTLSGYLLDCVTTPCAAIAP